MEHSEALTIPSPTRTRLFAPTPGFALSHWRPKSRSTWRMKPCRSGTRPRKKSAKLDCLHRSGHLPGPAVRRLPVIFWIIRPSFDGKAVLDLASGSGLVGIAAMKAGAAAVTVADIDAFACAAAQTQRSTRTPVHLSVIEDDLLAGTRPQNSWDVILAGDIFYERDTARRAFDFLQQARGKRRYRADRRSRTQLSALRQIAAALPTTACR